MPLALAGRFFITSATWEAPRHLNKCNQFQNLLLIILLFTPFLSFFISIDFSNSQLRAPSPFPSFIYKRMDESQYSKLRNGDIIYMDSPFRALSILILHFHCWYYFRLKIGCKVVDSTVKYSKSMCLLFAQTVIRKSLRVGKKQAYTDRNKSYPKTKNNPVPLSVKLSLLCS